MNSRLNQLDIAVNIWHEFLEQKIVAEKGSLDSIEPSAFNDWLAVQIAKADTDGGAIVPEWKQGEVAACSPDIDIEVER